MKGKKYAIIFLVLVSVVVISQLTKINIINTKALSPVGNTDDNKKLVNTEFGEDFNSFIQDNSNIKIYQNYNEKGYLVTINDKKIKIKEESYLVNLIKKGFLLVGNVSQKLINQIEILLKKLYIRINKQLD